MAPVRILKATARRLHKISGLTFLVVGFLALGAAVRALRFGAPIAFAWARGDEPRPAILALNILHGIFPIHQLGYDYHGAPPAYAVAVVFALLGPTPLAFDLAAYGAGLAILVTGYFLGRRILAAPVALLALATLAVPPLFLSQWSLHGNLNQSVGVAMGNLMLLGTHTLFFRRPGDPRSTLALGLVAGLGWWIKSTGRRVLRPVCTSHRVDGPVAEAGHPALSRRCPAGRAPSLALRGVRLSLLAVLRVPARGHPDAAPPGAPGRRRRDFLPRVLGVELGGDLLLPARSPRRRDPRLRRGRPGSRGFPRWSAPVPMGWVGAAAHRDGHAPLARVSYKPGPGPGDSPGDPRESLPPPPVLRPVLLDGATLAWLWRMHRVVGMLVSGLLLAFHLGSNWTAFSGRRRRRCDAGARSRPDPRRWCPGSPRWRRGRSTGSGPSRCRRASSHS